MLSLSYVPSSTIVAETSMSKNWKDIVRHDINKFPSTPSRANAPTCPPAASVVNHQHRGGSLLTSSASGVRSKFPAKLRLLLDDSELEGNQSIVAWLPHGRAFRVHKPKEFASKIVGRYFNHGQYRSFTRQLYHYGFGTMDVGQDMGAFYHPHFLRDEPALEYLIGRKNTETKKKSEVQVNPNSKQHSQPLNEATGQAPPPPVGMLASPFQTLNDTPKMEVDRIYHSSGIKERGISRLLTQLSTEDQEATKKHFKTREDIRGGGLPKTDFGGTRRRQNDIQKEVQDIGLLFGDDSPFRESISQMSLPVLRAPQHNQQDQEQDDWFSPMIARIPEDKSLGDGVFAAEDFEPRPIEEMILRSSHSPEKNDQQ